MEINWSSYSTTIYAVHLYSLAPTPSGPALALKFSLPRELKLCSLSSGVASTGTPS